MSPMMSSLSAPFEQWQVAAKQTKPERHHALAAITKASLNGISEAPFGDGALETRPVQPGTSGASRRYHPERRRERDLRSAGEGREHFADRMGSGGYHVRRLPLQRAGSRAYLDRGFNRRLETAPDRNIQREVAPFHFDRRKSGLAQDADHALFRRKGKRTGIVRSGLRQPRGMLVGRLKRRHQPGVVARLAPAGERHPPRRPQRSAHIGKGKRRFGEKHHAEPRDQQVGTCGLRSSPQ